MNREIVIKRLRFSKRFSAICILTAVVFCCLVEAAHLSAKAEEQVNEEPHIQSECELGLCCGDIIDENQNTILDNPITPRSALPDCVNLSKEKYFPPIRNQVGNSCAAWATTYYQFTYQVARMNGWNAKENNDYVFSPKYIWNYLNDGTGDGAVRTQCYKLLKEIGCIRWNEFPHNNANYDWYNASDTNTKLLALQNRVKHFETRTIVDDSNSTSAVIQGPNDSNLTMLKSTIASGHCLTIGSDPHAYNYVSLGQEFNNEYAVVSLSGSNSGHAMTIVGYDDNIWYDIDGDGVEDDYEKGALLLANSWGTSAHNHNDGYIWILYDALNKHSNYTNDQTSNRKGAIYGNQYTLIEVETVTPKLTVEITVAHTRRNDLRFELGSSIGEFDVSNYTQALSIISPCALNYDGSTSNVNQCHTYVFDYGAYNLYAGNSRLYWVNIIDKNNSPNGGMVIKIIWRDSTGAIVKSLNFSDQCGVIDNSNLVQSSISSFSSTVGTNENISSILLPNEMAGKPLTWTSSNTSCVTVSQTGVVTAIAPGTATITATTTDGTELTASCTYKVLKAYGKTWETAVSCNYGKNATIISEVGEECWAMYTPAQSGNYIFYSESDFDLRGYLYNSSADEIAANNDISASNKNFLCAAYLTAGQTYRLYITSPTNSTGEFAFYVVRKEPADKVAMANADARLMVFSASVPTLYDKAIIGINDYEVTVSFNNIYVESSNGIRAKLLTNYTPEIGANSWNVFVDISAVEELIGTALTVDIEFFVGNVSVVTTNFSTNPVAYKTTLISGVEVSANNSMQLLLADIPSADGEELTVLDSNKQPITVTSTTKAKTGMIILRKDAANNKIKEVMFVIVIGDVQGDGYINSLDVSFVLRHDAETQELTGVYVIAGDVNIDGDTNSLDASLISRYDAKLIEISQDVIYTEVPDCIYYQYPVDFDLYN